MAATYSSSGGISLKSLLGIVLFACIISSSCAQRFNFTDVAASIRPSNIANYTKYISSIPHTAGTVADLQQALWIKREWERLRMDVVKLISYDVLLSYSTKDKPNKISISDSQGKKFETLGVQPPLMLQDFSNNTLPNYLAYTPSGTVESSCLVYAFYGRVKDFQALEALRINVSGCIVIARLGSLFRGNIIINAQERGAVGVILYSDPSDVAPPNQPVYPKGPYYPPTAAQKGTSNPYPGDLLTPGFPAKGYAFRQDISNATLPKILAQSIGYGEALEFLKVIKPTNQTPSGWQGGLNVSYEVGPQLVRPDLKIRMVSNNYNKIATTYNVIGMINGSLEPDRWVIVGNHRDAWDFGGSDPSAAMGSVMEMARVFTTLTRTRGRTQRSMVFCSFGAEEFNMIGSMEWVEDFMKVLKQKAVIFLGNDQGCGMNHMLYAAFTPSLRPVIQQVVGRVRNPNAAEFAAGRKTILDTMLYMNPDPKNNKSINIPFFGSFSDYHSFQFVAGISSLYLVYLSSDFDNHFLYHTLYDTYFMVTNFSDPGFVCNAALTQVHAGLTLSFADSRILPFDLSEYGNYIDSNVKSFADKYGTLMESNNVTLSHFKKAAENLKNTTASFMRTVSATNYAGFPAQRITNDKLMNFERYFIDENAPAYGKHSVMSVNPRSLYSGSTFASLTDLLGAIGNKTRPQDPNNWNKLHYQLAVITNQFEQAAASLSDGI